MQFFPGRLGVDFDSCLQEIVLVRKHHVRFAALEERLEKGPEIRADSLKRCFEMLARRRVDLGDRLVKIVFGLEEVLLLRL